MKYRITQHLNGKYFVLFKKRSFWCTKWVIKAYGFDTIADAEHYCRKQHIGNFEVIKELEIISL